MKRMISRVIICSAFLILYARSSPPMTSRRFPTGLTYWVGIRPGGGDELREGWRGGKDKGRSRGARAGGGGLRRATRVIGDARLPAWFWRNPLALVLACLELSHRFAARIAALYRRLVSPPHLPHACRTPAAPFFPLCVGPIVGPPWPCPGGGRTWDRRRRPAAPPINDRVAVAQALWMAIPADAVRRIEK
jgi:hypothetical protein